MDDFSITDYLARKARLLGNSTERGIKEIEFMQRLGGDGQDPEFNTTPLPMAVFNNKRLLSESGAGASLTQDTTTHDDIPNFYANSKLLNLCTVFPNLKDNPKFSKKTRKTTNVEGVAENVSNMLLAAHEPQSESVTLEPKFTRVSFSISKTLLIQSAKDLDQIITTDIQDAITSKIERDILTGTDAEDITSIASETGINEVIWTGATEADQFGKITELEQAAGNDNVPPPYIFLGNSGLRKRLRETPKSAGAVIPILDNRNQVTGFRIQGGINHPILSDDNKIMGYDFLEANNLPDENLWLVNPAYILVGFWNENASGSMIEIAIDPWTLSNQDLCRVTVSCACNAKLIAPHALSVLRPAAGG